MSPLDALGALLHGMSALMHFSASVQSIEVSLGSSSSVVCVVAEITEFPDTL